MAEDNEAVEISEDFLDAGWDPDDWDLFDALGVIAEALDYLADDGYM